MNGYLLRHDVSICLCKVNFRCIRHVHFTLFTYKIAKRHSILIYNNLFRSHQSFFFRSLYSINIPHFFFFYYWLDKQFFIYHDRFPFTFYIVDVGNEKKLWLFDRWSSPITAYCMKLEEFIQLDRIHDWRVWHTMCGHWFYTINLFNQSTNISNWSKDSRVVFFYSSLSSMFSLST